MLLDLGEGLRPDESTLGLWGHGSKSGNSILGACSSPQVGAWVEVDRETLALGLLVVDLGDLDDLLLNVAKSVVWNVSNLVLDAVLLEGETAAGEEEIGRSGGWQVRDTVTDHDNHGDLSILGLDLCSLLVLVDGQGLVVAVRSVVTPNNLPVGTLVVDDSVVGDNVDSRASLFTEEVVEDRAEDRPETGGNDVEWNVVLDTELVKVLELRVNLKSTLHLVESVCERNIEGTPHLLGNIAEGSLARLDLLVEDLALFGTAAELVEKNVTSVLHEDCAVKVGEADNLSLGVELVSWWHAALRGLQVLSLDIWSVNSRGSHCLWYGLRVLRWCKKRSSR